MAVAVFTCSHSFGPTFAPVVLEEFGRMTKKSLWWRAHEKSVDRHRFAGGVVGLYSLEV